MADGIGALFKNRTLAVVCTLCSATALALYTAWLPYLSGIYESAMSHVEWAQTEAALEDEFLVVVAPFRYLNVPDNDETRRLAKHIEKSLERPATDVGLKLRVSVAPASVEDADAISEAILLADSKNASVIVWGDISQTHLALRYHTRIYDQLDLSWSYGNQEIAEIDDFHQAHSVDMAGFAEFTGKSFPEAVEALGSLAIRSRYRYLTGSDRPALGDCK